MTDKASELVQGTLDMLILRTLALEPMHGYGIALRIEQISRGVFRVNPGSLFPAFRRLEREGWIKPEWRPTENNRRAKYYQLTERGSKQLKAETEEWGRQIAAIARIMEIVDCRLPIERIVHPVQAFNRNGQSKIRSNVDD